MIKVVHCGDMHLDSPFSSVNQSDIKAALKKELISDFCKMVEFCRENQVDIILIAGDLFESSTPSDECVTAVISALSEFEGLVFITPGNHDPLIPGSVYDKVTFPENVYIFRSESLTPVHFEIKGCSICLAGFGFTSYSYYKNPLISDIEFSPEQLNIICAHGDLYSTDSSYAPISKSSISAIAPHYLALAHIHKRSSIATIGNTAYSYCGSLSGRDFGETGEKGCYLLEFDSKKPAPPISCKFIPIGSRRYEEREFNIQLFNSANPIIQSLEGDCLEENCHLRLIINGERNEQFNDILKNLEAGIEARVSYFEIVDNTTLPIDYNALEADPSITGEFYRLLKPQLENNEDAHLALKTGLAALQGEDPLKWLPTNNKNK